MIAQRSFLNALGTIAYIVAIVLIISNLGQWFVDEKTIVIPMAMISLFVVSATVTGGLVLGKPILMYWDGQKADAIKMFLYTIGWLALGTIVIGIIAAVVN